MSLVAASAMRRPEAMARYRSGETPSGVRLRFVERRDRSFDPARIGLRSRIGGHRRHEFADRVLRRDRNRKVRHEQLTCNELVDERLRFVQTDVIAYEGCRETGARGAASGKLQGRVQVVARLDRHGRVAGHRGPRIEVAQFAREPVSGGVGSIRKLARDLGRLHETISARLARYVPPKRAWRRY